MQEKVNELKQQDSSEWFSHSSLEALESMNARAMKPNQELLDRLKQIAPEQLEQLNQLNEEQLNQLRENMREMVEKLKQQQNGE